jgi:hypothetical protein
LGKRKFAKASGLGTGKKKKAKNTEISFCVYLIMPLFIRWFRVTSRNVHGSRKRNGGKAVKGTVALPHGRKLKESFLNEKINDDAITA